MNGPERYTFDTIRDQVDKELRNKEMPQRLYNSTDSVFRIVDAIIKTKGEGWAAQALDNNGNPILTGNEQVKFTDAIQPYLESIIGYLDSNGKESLQGGMYKPNIEKISGMSKDFIKTKLTQANGVIDDPTKMIGPDDIYARIVKKIGNIDTIVNDYASKYGVLRLEKDHDLAPDPRIIPQPVALALSEGIFALSTVIGFPIPPDISIEVLSKIKIPFRTIVFIIYLALDVTRISMALTDRILARKLLSVALAILELLRGDWKKAILTFIGFYGMYPLLAGQVGKVFLTLFKQLSPQLQTDIIFGSLSVTKSLIVGLLLSIFQITAPEEIRLPLIGILEKIAQRKAEIDGKLVDAGLSARPDYLSPTFEDFNNIQAVMNDNAYLCSCEFEELIKAVDKSAVIRIILQVLSIPITTEFRDVKCGPGPCQPFIKQIVKESVKDKEEEERLNGPITPYIEPRLNPDNVLTAPVSKLNDPTSLNSTNQASSLARSPIQGITDRAAATVQKATDKRIAYIGSKKEDKPNSVLPKLKTNGGRILHSRKNGLSLIA